MNYEGVPARLAAVQARILERQRASGFAHPVKIIAVTKGHSVAAVRAAHDAGLTAVGENRVQEALDKQAAAGALQLEWHLIGSLQRNKVKHAVGRFALIHSVDRAELLSELAHRVVGPRQAVLVEVNCSDEEQKGGVGLGEAIALVERVVATPAVEFRGLMTMAALTDDRAVQRAAFGRLRRLKAELEGRGIAVPELSMGMSADYEVAVEEGATMVRLGTILFGERGS